MSPRPTAPCPHDRRPGTKVCLHCRREARLAARSRRIRAIARVAVGAVTIAILGAIGVAAASALHDDTGSPILLRAASAGSTTTVASSGEPVAARPRSAAPGVAAAAPRPVVAEGRTELHGGIYAERVGDTVTVHFDTQLDRTRRPPKFERIVRATLPVVYGAPADSALAALPEGAIAQAGDLLTELPVRGVRVPLAGGWTLTVLPQTRPGEDGPLVIAYRATVAR
ncbi:MAG TPA: hypothetical protein VF041_07310 [Gemmatimonadaceae bacterium]